jgi:DNA polymerase-1
VALSAYRSIWVIDTEYKAAPDADPIEPICIVGKEVRTGRTVVGCWPDLGRCPVPGSKAALVVAYNFSAEARFYHTLGWPIPANILDLYVERMRHRNGRFRDSNDKLLTAMAEFGLAHMAPGEKADMIDLINRGAPYSGAELDAIVAYCTEDVEATARLLPAMEHEIGWPHCLFYGEYMAAVGLYHKNGVPIDTDYYTSISNNWDSVKLELVRRVDQKYGVFEGTTLKTALLEDYIQRSGIDWPRSGTGRIKTDKDSLKDVAVLHPEIEDLRELLKTLGGLKLNDLQVGRDGRNRVALFPVKALTGRNQPSNSKFVYGPAKWVRSLVKPAKGEAILAVDWEQQEFLLAAVLSGDERMIDAYYTGDPYLALAIQMRIAPKGATRHEYEAERKLAKTAALAAQYGQGAVGAARKLGCSVTKAEEILRLHRKTYKKYWAWTDAVVSDAMQKGEIVTEFGWRRQIDPLLELSREIDRAQRVGRSSLDFPLRINTRPLKNFLIQATGAHLLQISSIAAMNRGLELAAPIHDAIVLVAPASQANEHAKLIQDIMGAASEFVLGGCRLRTELEIVRHPDRFYDKDGKAMWQTVCDILGLKP